MTVEGKEHNKPESAVFSVASMDVLAREVASYKEISAIVFLMYLNIPTSNIVNFTGEISEMGLRDAKENDVLTFVRRCLAFWVQIHSHGKEKDRALDVERAFTAMGNQDAAESFKDRYSNNTELASDMFVH